MMSSITKKTFTVLLSLLFLVTISCQDDETDPKKGLLVLSFDDSIEPEIEAEQRFLVVTIEDQSNNKIYDRKKIELLSLEDSFLSDAIELEVGIYTITELFVLNEEGEIEFATPMEGSNLADRVDDPLPIEFTITNNHSVEIMPQVLSVKEFPLVEDFGYSIFPFEIASDLIEFEQIELMLKERGDLEVKFVLEKALESTDTILLKVTNNTTQNNDYSSSIQIENNTIKVPGIANQTTLGFTLNAKYDSEHEDTEDLNIEIVGVPTKFKVGVSANVHIEVLNNDIGDGLVGEYAFSGNAEDTSPGFNNNGSVFGAILTTDRKGNANSAYSFDGINDYVSIPDNNSTDFSSSQDFSISLWVSVKFPQATPGDAIFDILRKWSGDAQGYPYSISFLNENAGEQNKFLIVRSDGSGCLNVPSQYSSVIDSEAWHHVVMVKQGAMIYHYLDNVKVSEVIDNTSCTTTNNSHITVGSRGQLVRFFTGKIDDIRFYNRALTLADIQTLFEE